MMFPLYHALQAVPTVLSDAFYQYLKTLDADIYYPLDDAYSFVSGQRSQILDHSGNDIHATLYSSTIPDTSYVKFREPSKVPGDPDGYALQTIKDDGVGAAVVSPRSSDIPAHNEDFSVSFFGYFPSERESTHGIFRLSSNNGVNEQVAAYVVDFRIQGRDHPSYPQIQAFRNTASATAIATLDDSAIHHIAITINGSTNSVKIYIDNVLVINFTGVTPVERSDRWFMLGGLMFHTDIPPTNCMRGHYQHFQLWRNKILSVDEISEIYDYGINGVPPLVDSGTEPPDPPVIPDPNILTPGIATTTNTRGKVSLANSWGARIACDGSVVSWGTFAPTAINSVLPDGTTFTRVSVAGTGGIALKTDGDAVVWGYKPNAAYYGGSPVLYQSPPDDMDIRDVVALSGLPYFYCLLPDGSVYSWNGEAGEIVDDTDLIPDDEECVAIAAGSYFGAGVLSDGTVSVWASSLNGSSVALLDVPVEATDIIDIACGYYHIVALKDDGSIVCWGNDDNDQCQVPVLSSPAVSISCGSVSSHATLQNGEVVSWGSNTYGEASPPSSLIDAVRVYPSAGSSIFAARSNGNIVGWGRNTSDQVSGAQGEELFCAATEGTVTPPDPDPSPDPVPPPEPAPVFTLPLAKNPVVYADAAMFGLHYNGRILLWGRESSITRNAPVFLRKAYTDMTVVFDGISYAVLVLQTNGRIAGWGSDSGAFEKLKSPFVDNGNRALFDYINAKQVTALPSAIYKYITVVLEDGTVDCKYLSYKVGSPPPPRPKPSLIYRPPAPSSGGPAVDDNPYLPSGGLPITNAIQVSCTNDMCFALGSDGVVHGWGPASLGAYYLSPLTSYTEQTGSVGAPGQYSRGLSDIVKIDSQFGLVVALDDSGEVTVWGKPDMQYWVPQPGTLPTIVDVAAGKHHIVALGDDGVIYCWGNNKVGQCNVPAGLGRVNRIRASDYQSIAILDSGKVVVWGAFPAYTQKSINQINFYQ